MAGHGRGHGFAKPKNAKGTIKRVAAYLKKHKLLLLLVMLFVLISTLGNVAGTYMLKPIIDDYISPLIGTNPSGADFIPLAKMLGLMAGVYSIAALAAFSYRRIMLYVSNKTLNEIRGDLYNHMEDLPLKYFDTHTHGELMSRYTNDVDALREAISNGVVQLFSSSISVISTFILMLILSPVLTLFIVLMLVVMLFAVKKIGGKSAKYFKRQQAALGAANGYIEELIEGQNVVKVFCHEDKAEEEFSALNEELRISSSKANTYASVIMPIMGNLSYVNYAITTTVGAFLIIGGMLEVGAVVTFLQCTRTFSQPITQISQQLNAIISALAGAERIFEVLDEETEVDEGYVTLVNCTVGENGKVEESEKRTGQWAWKHPHGDGTLTYTPLKGDVRFHNVVFSYDGKKTVLNDVSLFARPGEKIAFVGSTGAGKTTITNLINRFYDVSEGKITYDGINVKKIKKSDLRRSLAMVLQDTHLFTGTVKENIAYGNFDATDEEIVAAAKLANAHSFIKRLPHGYDTVLTGDGANLSQGQRQLLAIARAAVADPPVLILDEATSSIDTRTEELIEKGMDSLMRGRTVFVIAHRLSTVRNSNAIMVLENGEIIERGSHDELIDQKGKYYQLYTGQFELS